MHVRPVAGSQGSVPGGEKCWVDQVGAAEICANCGRDSQTAFCSACGQRRLDKRLEFWELLKDVVSRLLNWEKGWGYTFIQLCRRPGVVAREYCMGKQRRYVNPLAYFLIAAAAQLILLWCIESHLREILVVQFQRSAIPTEATADLEIKLGRSLPDAMADAYISSVQQGYTYVALLFFSIPFAILLKWMHGLLGTRFRLGETMVFALFAVAQMLLITAFVTPLVLWLLPSMQVVVGPMVYLAIGMHAHGGFFQAGWVPRFMTGIALVISAAGFLVTILVVFISTFAVQSIMAITSSAAG